MIIIPVPKFETVWTADHRLRLGFLFVVVNANTFLIVVVVIILGLSDSVAAQAVVAAVVAGLASPCVGADAAVVTFDICTCWVSTGI